MTTTVANEPIINETKPGNTARLRRLVRSRFVRELLIILAFTLMTAAVTWPYAGRMRNAVAGPGDPYLVAWMMWWDYHQTFTDPLNLFNSNTLYPYKYTLAFSETCYGVALPFFPLYALGFTPLTVHSVAMFLGFALSGYAAFRLMRTLSGSTSAAWVAGIIFAFIPYRFNLMAQLMYLWSVWLPLLFEAMVLFVATRSWKRAIWLGVAFFMTGLTTITWLMLSIIPLALIVAILLTRHRLWRERQFWSRGLISLGVAAAALLPFTIPFYLVKKIYGFKRSIDDVRAHSASPMHWLVAEGRSKLWSGMGNKIPEAWKFQMFPGLLPLLLPLGELILGSSGATTSTPDIDETRLRWARRLDLLALFAFALLIPALGFANSEDPGRLFTKYLAPDYLLAIFAVALIARICLAYPKFLRRNNANLIQTISNVRTDAFWIAITLIVIGFLYSIGWNTFFYRLLYYHVPGFKSIRAPMRGAMFAYLGLSLLSGLGVKRLAGLVTRRFLRFPAIAIYLVVCGLLLLELNNSPLYFIRGDAYPDGVTRRLKELSMRGGITYFPAGIDFNQRYMLRAADHQKPLILGTSGFSTPYVNEIERMTAAGPIPKELMDLFEKIPASYLVVEQKLIPELRTKDFNQFLVREISSGRLRYINSYDGHSDLYAIVKTEPEAKSEASLPSSLAIRDWAGMIQGDPVNFLNENLSFSQRMFRVFVATHGMMPRYKEFIAELEKIGQGVIVGSDEQEKRISDGFQKLIAEWTKSDSLGQLNDTQYVTRLLENAGVGPEPGQALIDGLTSGNETRASVLLKVVDDPQFVEKQNYPSLVELHYFVFLRRNPDDPPDGNLNGFNFWIQDLERNHDPSKISKAFKIAGEYVDAKKTE